MHLKSLRVFCDVVGRRSFSRAADANGISQSGASQVVHQLEEKLGVRLIDRSKRPFVLTPEGEVYYDGCRRLVQRYSTLVEKVRTLHHEVAGRVSVASIYSVGLHHMARYVTQFLSRYPKANVRLEYLHPHRVYEAVESDQSDLGLVSYPKESRTLEALSWRTEPMVFVCAPEHPLAASGRLGLEELSGQRLISFDDNLVIRHEIDRVLNRRRIDVEVAMEFDNVETIKRAIEINAGVGLLPEPTIGREVAAGTLVAIPLTTDELVRPIGIIHRKGKELSVTALRFIDLLRDKSNSDTASSSDGAEMNGSATATSAAGEDGEPIPDDTGNSSTDRKRNRATASSP